MSDISRQEKINNRIAELEHRIYEKAEEYGNNKWKRVKRTFFVLCGVIYLMTFYFELDSHALSISNINFETIENIFYLLVVATFGVGFFAGMIMFVSYAVWYYCITRSLEEEKTLAKMIAELNTIKYFDATYK